MVGLFAIDSEPNFQPHNVLDLGMGRESDKGSAITGRDPDYEKDSLHILPLHIIPLKTPGLRQARMIKNVQFESMIEVFHDEETGSGQVDPSKLGIMFGWPKGEKHPDGVLIAKLGLLQSFDIYTLRKNLHSFGVQVEDIADLRLSGTRQRELNRYMRDFTRPLTNLIFSDGDNVGINDISDLVGIFREQNNKVALDNLKRLSAKLKVILNQLPAFLADYGDVFLSLAYFKDRFDAISPMSEFFLASLGKLKHDDTLKNDPQIVAAFSTVEEELNDILVEISGRLQTFDNHSAAMWEDLTAESFRKVKLLIESNHATVGGMLCGLEIKMAGFYEREATNREVADHIVSNIRPGIDRIKSIEKSAHYANQV